MDGLVVNPVSTVNVNQIFVTPENKKLVIERCRRISQMQLSWLSPENASRVARIQEDLQAAGVRKKYLFSKSGEERPEEDVDELIVIRTVGSFYWKQLIRAMDVCFKNPEQSLSSEVNVSRELVHPSVKQWVIRKCKALSEEQIGKASGVISPYLRKIQEGLGDRQTRQKYLLGEDGTERTQGMIDELIVIESIGPRWGSLFSILKSCSAKKVSSEAPQEPLQPHELTDLVMPAAIASGRTSVV